MKTNLSILLAILSLAISVCILLSQGSGKKIAYIRSSELVYGYFGMQEAHRDFEEKSKIWKTNIDTLQFDFQKELSKYTAEAIRLSAEDKKLRERLLGDQQQNLLNYSRSIEAKAKEEDEQIAQGVLNQVNSFVEDYGKKNGYDIILGTTTGGSILYGVETIDITKEVLEALNRNYKGEKAKG